MRKRARSILSAILSTLMVAAGVMSVSVSAYSQRTAQRQPARPAPQLSKPLSVYDQGYSKGYNDGFAAGQNDWQQGAARDFESSNAFRQRDQSYDQRYASSDDYVQAFELGFELGYLDGYYGRPRSTAVPSNGAVIAKAATLANTQRAREQAPPNYQRDNPPQYNPNPPNRPDTRPDTSRDDATRPRRTTPVDIQANTLLNLRLNSTIDTKNSRAGDRFTAVVIGPPEYEGATIEGHIANINKSGRVTGRTELALAFDTITFQDGRQAEISAALEKVVESETVKKVDEEGNVQSGSRSTDSQKRGGIGAAAGAILGGIIGGGKGAVLGAVLGGAAGVGTVYVEGNKDLILEPGTEMIIRVERGRVR